MKKLVLSFTLVALIAGAVLGGQAIASNKPADVTVSQEMSEEILFDWGSSYRGYPVRMKTLSGNLTVLSEGGRIEENYSGVRHVSLTLFILGIDHINDYGGLQVYFGDSFGPDLDGYSNEVVYRTYEFDAERWAIYVYNEGGDPVDIRYHATITYPSNQW
jgi:hypothetical protein